MMDFDDDIAVVGIGCNFPGGEGLENYWKVLVEGRNCTVEIPDERFDSTFWYDSDESKPGKTQVTKATLIEGFNEFDHKFFGITETEANYMDPQQKLLLHCTYRALEDAGMPMEKASGTRTGVYIGLMNRDYETLLNNSPSTITHYNGTGTAMSLAANRISYTFNLTGPSFAIDSACSSSLVALHLACQAIRQGDCEMAICGGVSCILEPRVFVALSKAKMISHEGTSKPFSNRADGYGRGEGCGIVILKPLQKALQDFDHVWGTISKTAVNQDGRTVTPITKPSRTQQEELLTRVYLTETERTNVQYIEAHGTGTAVGDPVEASSISRVIAKSRPPGSGPLYIGSVKANIGHTESAAGIAGLIKVLLMMKHETFVPTVFYSEESSSIDTEALNLKIPTEVEKWQRTASSRRVAGLNNFGFGGTNAHAIIKEYIQTPVSKLATLDSKRLFVLSAATNKSLGMCIADTYQKISTENPVDLKSLLYTSACRRTHIRHKYRKVFLTSSVSDLGTQLKSCLNKIFMPCKSDLRLVFVFCGNGVTYRGMCKKLLKEEPVFREKIREVESLFQNYTAISIVQRIANTYDSNDNSKPEVVQPLIFAIQVAIASLLNHWGIRPDAILGHSVGEVAAAHCSGLLSLEDAVKVIYYRSILQSQVTGGKMLVVGNAVVTDILKILPAYAGKVCLAALNSPLSCVLSGDGDAIDSVREQLNTSFKSKNLFLHVLDVPAAYHSHMMDPILGPVKDYIGCLSEHDMICELFSTVTGKIYCPGDFTTGDYWARNIRKLVAFEQAVKAAANNMKNVLFIEIGPRGALKRNIIETLGNDTTVLSSVQPDKDHATMLSVAAKLFELGVNVDWDKFYRGFEAPLAPFPRYQFECLNRKVYFEEVRRGNELLGQSSHPLISSNQHDNKVYKCNLSSCCISYIWEHKISGLVIAPGALYVELGLASVMASVIPKRPLSALQLSINFQSFFIIAENSPPLRVVLEPYEGKTTFQILSSTTVHASGTIDYNRGQVKVEEPSIVLDAVLKRCQLVLKREQVYTFLSQGGFEYGPIFRQLNDVNYGHEFKEAVTTVRIPDGLLKQLHEYCLHPVVLDYFLQMTCIAAFSTSTIRPGFPSSISSVVVSAPLREEMVMYLRITKETPDYFEVCGCFADLEGCVLIELKHVRITFVGGHWNIADSCFFYNELLPIISTFRVSSKPRALVFEDTLGVAKALKPYLHPESIFVSLTDLTNWSTMVPDLLLQCHESASDAISDLTEILFICGIQNIGKLKTETVLERLVESCELYRQVVMSLRKDMGSCTFRVITYRSSEMTVDYISPGLVLSGMTRACAAEISSISFQLIDLASVSNEDIEILVHVICSYQSNAYPEVIISKGRAHSVVITRTPIKNTDQLERCKNSLKPQCFTLQTADPYTMSRLSAVPSEVSTNSLDGKTVEIQLHKIGVHSSDYYPVSITDIKFGRTVYWNKHTNFNHKLLMFDFSGTVTAVGKDVRKLTVGDHIISCYPIAASTKVVIPEDVCYKSETAPFLKEVPCLSFVMLAWEILCRVLPRMKILRELHIFSSIPHSVLLRVLTLMAKKSGWCVHVETDSNVLFQNTHQCSVFVLLPPYNQSMVSRLGSSATAKHIIVVCDNKESFPFASNMLQHENENVCFHTIHISKVLQRAYLKSQRAEVHKWLSAMYLNVRSITIPSRIIQIRTPGETMVADSVEHSESYFTAKTISLIGLSDDGLKVNISDVSLLSKPKPLFIKNGVYIVSGGLSGLGLETVRYIAHKGGGGIVTLSRSGPSEEMQLEMNILQKRYEVTIFSLQCDVSASEQVVEAISTIGKHFPSYSIKGVFHSAAVLHDGLIETLDRSLFEKVLRPKVSGALNLHYATLNSKMDYFVCYSSISSFIGNTSQANYAAANSFLDTFCHYRRNLGLTGQAINWGPLNLGLLWNKQNFQRFLEAKGLMIMNVPEIHEALDHCLLANNPQQVVCKFNFINLKNHVLSQNTSLKVRLSALVERELENTNVTISATNLQSSAHEYVRSLLAEFSDMDIDELSDDVVLSAVGIDSMLAMTIQNRIFQDRGVNIPLVKLLDPECTISTLVVILKHTEECHRNIL
ncbi:uncharacterized protein LOC115806718 [Chanos chanos]|uniref:Uncharacterized protein LOC115806718 n=1 Tax=Chanos chanos TaxID=29144 RepID=A0A6J2UTQ4_CHACN|nr:uncharacterized protein LOC115806718 [Chanos chanos]